MRHVLSFELQIITIDRKQTDVSSRALNPSRNFILQNSVSFLFRLHINSYTKGRKGQQLDGYSLCRSFCSGISKPVLSSIDCSQPSIFSYFLSLNARIPLRENWTPAQNGRFDWVGGGDREK